MVSQLAFLLFLFIVLLLTLLLYRRQRMPGLRSITALEELPGQTGRAAESGRILHLSLGTGGVSGSDTITSLAGVAALAHLAEQGVATGTPPLVTVSDPTLLPVAQNVVRQAYARRGQSEDFQWTQVRMVAPSPMAYALGTMDILRHESVLANLMFGAFGLEVGLIASAGAGANLVQVGGSDDPQALAILYSTADRVVVGEELFATGAYLDRKPAQVVSLIAEDVARIVLIVFVILYALLRWVGAL